MWYALFTLLVPVAAAQTPAENKVDFAALGKAFVAEHCPPKTSAPCAQEEVLSANFVQLTLGPFDLQIPHSMLANKAGIDNLRNIALALSLQVNEWVRWQGAQTAFDLDMLMAVPGWMAHWKPINEAQIRKAKSRDLLDIMAASDSERAAMKTIETLCDDGEKLALRIPEGRQLQVILAPARLDFMRWIGYGGLVDETSKANNWFDDAAQWTQCWLGWKLVLALEYASWEGFDPTFKASQPMKKVGDGIMAQHVVQQATYGLLRACRPTVPESRYDSALAMLMTIDACGEINTIEGAGGVSASGGKTKPYSKFVPGGNPKGGTLPGRSARGLSVITESRWRKGHGADGFSAPIKNGQVEGLKAAKGLDKVDPVATFVMRQEDNSGKHIVRAPFFGPHADEQEYPPGEYLVDYAEFYRAYKAAFFHWLEHTGIDSKSHAAQWSELMRALPTIGDKLDFDGLVAQVYGLPISAKDDSTDSLEWRFLRSISKAK